MDSWLVWEKVWTCKGEKNDVEKSIRKVDGIDNNGNMKGDFMVRESAIACNRQRQDLWITLLNAWKPDS
jgi:hypothetical protein